jgi:hypothetical protein
MASTRLKRTPSSTGTRTKFTYSAWIKRSDNGYHPLMSSWSANTDAGYISLRFGTNGKLDCTGWSTQWFETTQVFRDVNAWYHIVLSVDSTLATEGETSQNQEFPLSHSGTPHFIGVQFYSGSTYSHYYDGSMSHVHFIDGTAYPASTFGETDSTTGECKIKTSPSVTYGTNGFFILKDGNSVTDQSGQGNNLTVDNGTLTKTEDCPSNVFCTLNPINSRYISIIQGNNTASGGNNGSDYSYIASTLAANSGKFYWEVKAADLAEIDQVGVARASSSFSNVSTGHGLQGTPYGGKSVQFSNGNKAGDDSQSAYMGGFSTDDIMMIALDLDNNKITFGRNGQWANSSGGADQTYANSTAAFTNLTAGEYYMPCHAMRGYGGNTGISRYNFGNGYFATTAVSSAGTNASGIGIFEYDVPTGFTALSTKGLNE